MPKFCANLTMLYTEHDFLDRFAAASADGFAGVEYMFPYAFRKEDLAEALVIALAHEELDGRAQPRAPIRKVSRSERAQVPHR